MTDRGKIGAHGLHNIGVGLIRNGISLNPKP